MIGYTMVGTDDLERSLKFYGPLFAEMGLEECWRDSQCASWGRPDDESYPRFFTGYPFDGKGASSGNGTMTAFLISDPEAIERLYDLALRNGGSSEGEPGYSGSRLIGNALVPDQTRESAITPRSRADSRVRSGSLREPDLTRSALPAGIQRQLLRSLCARSRRQQARLRQLRDELNPQADLLQRSPSRLGRAVPSALFLD